MIPQTLKIIKNHKENTGFRENLNFWPKVQKITPKAPKIIPQAPQMSPNASPDLKNERKSSPKALKMSPNAPQDLKK